VSEHTYDAGDIQVLEGLEPVRLRPGMYIGSTGPRGLHHLVYEVVDNSVDEALAGECDRIDVTVLPDSSVRVVDNGRGIPVAIMPQYGKSALEIVLCKLHAGGKFGGAGYKVSGGLHGVGISVVNALSERLTAEVCRDDYRWSQTYSRGVPEGDVVRHEACETTGTTIHFLPDSQIFDDLNFNFNVLSQRLREVAFLNRGLSISLRDERDHTGEEARAVNAAGEPLVEGEEVLADGDARPEAAAGDPAAPVAVDAEDGAVVAPGMQLALGQAGDTGKGSVRSVSYKYDGGIIDFVRHINAQRDPIHSTIVYLSPSCTSGLSTTPATRWNWPCSGTPATSTMSSASPTTSTPTRVARICLVFARH